LELEQNKPTVHRRLIKTKRGCDR